MLRTLVGGFTVLALLVPGSAFAAQGAASSPSPFGGNGHNVTFDGRLYLVRTSLGWETQVFRPQNVSYDGTGFPDMNAGAFSARALVNASPSGENALAICETNPANTPFKCNLAGAMDAGGAFDCYDLIVFDSNAEQPASTMRWRPLKVWVNQPKTANAAIEKFAEGAILPVTPTLYGIEPTITKDGKLMVWQGHPDNNGAEIDILMYSKTATPCSGNGWSAPKPISSMNTDPAVVNTYKLAEKPLRAADGTIFAPGDLFRGAYPWVFPDGEAVIFAATGMPCITQTPENPPGCGPRRNSISVIGYPTNWGIAHVDGGVNPSRTDQVRLFFSSPGPNTFTSIPVTQGADVWPFFGSNTSNYTEVSFDDGLDGRYAGVWHMNELVKKDGTLDIGRTPDTGGYFNTGILQGGAVIPEANNAPFGKAVVLDGVTGRVSVTNAAPLNPLNAITVEMWLNPTSDPDCDGNNNWRLLAGKPYTTGSYSLVFEENRWLQGRIFSGGAERAVLSNMPIPVGVWTHVAFTYSGSTGEMAFFVNGVETNRVFHPAGTLDSSVSSLTFGGPGISTACPNGLGAFHGALDEVRISNIVRYPVPITEPTPTPTPEPTGTATPGPTPTPTPGNPGDPSETSNCGCVLADAAVPLPSLLASMLLGIALIGLARRRR